MGLYLTSHEAINKSPIGNKFYPSLQFYIQIYIACFLNNYYWQNISSIMWQLSLCIFKALYKFISLHVRRNSSPDSIFLWSSNSEKHPWNFLTPSFPLSYFISQSLQHTHTLLRFVWLLTSFSQSSY